MLCLYCPAGERVNVLNDKRCAIWQNQGVHELKKRLFPEDLANEGSPRGIFRIE
jgi:hypothetical protein